MSLLELAVLVVGIWLIIVGASSISATGTLIFGIVVAALVLIGLLTGYTIRRP